MEAGTAEERSRLLPEASVGYGLIGNDQSTLNIRDINYNINNGKTAKQTRTLKASLYFPEMANRERNVENTHEQTGRWFLETKQYLNWEAGGRRTAKSGQCCGLLIGSASILKERWQDQLLWIKGNAGAGKSTLLKMAVEHAKKTYKKALILPHFFNARGNALERSTEGMYRTLLYWILEKLPQELESSFYPQDLFAERAKWEVPELVRLLEAAMENLRDRVVLFYVDALDECEQKDIRAMLEVFRRLVETAWKSGHEVRVCFASRPFPHYTFNHAVYLDLSEQEEHDEDIAKYIEACLNDGIAEFIRDQVQKKAAGVFMWVVLVVDMLNENYDAGHTGRLEELVKSIPAGLYELYGHILERHPGDEDAMLECFRWLLFYRGDVQQDQLWWLVQLRLERSDEDIRRDFEAQTTATRKRYILHIGKGLIRFALLADFDGTRYLEFIHESVREFILDKNSAVLRMYGVQSRDALKEQSHQQLRNSWFNEWMARRPQLLNLLDTKGRSSITGSLLVQLGWAKPSKWLEDDASSLPGLRFPLGPWATEGLADNAEYAQQLGFSQARFLNMLSQYAGPFWIWCGPGENHQVMDSLAGFLIARDCPTLIREPQREIVRRAIQSREPIGLVDEGSEWSPVSIALTFRSRPESVDALLELYLESQSRDPRLQHILQHLAENHSGPGRVQPPRFGQLLDLSRVDPLLATFFLIALAPPHTLESHLNSLQQLADEFYHEEDDGLSFSQTLLLFVQEQLQSIAIDILDKDTMRWLESMERKGRRADEEFLYDSEEEGSDEEDIDEEGINEEDIDEEDIVEEGGNIEESWAERRKAREREEIRQRGQICQQIAALIKARE
ncbi:hypothetical protein CC79DRAFT_1401597 [Sarocladium strictum]